MVNKSLTATTIGIDAHLVEVEVDTLNSLPGMSIVGLPDNAVSEARERVRSAIKNSGFSFPQGKVVVNLAPADIKKEGTNFDLPIAIGILKEDGVFPNPDTPIIKNPDKIGFIGELSLDGSLRGVNGVLSLVLGLKNAGVETVFVPKENVYEAGMVEGITVYGVSRLAEIIQHYTNDPLTPTKVDVQEYLNNEAVYDYPIDFKDVKGQKKAKRALEIAAAGGHNMLMSGPPGSGKTLMARCFATILPPLKLEEALELTKIYSISGLLPSDKPLVTMRPYRMVHHTASAFGIIGGGGNPKPGEITLAHRGVLFLDEIVEFPRNVLEVLRQPLEDGEVVISRAKFSVKYPARFMLIAAMNPCPCGFLGDPEKQCTCSDSQIQRYRSKLSGPLLDRIDLNINVPKLSTEELVKIDETTETSEQIRTRVIEARNIQAERFKNEGIFTNAEMNAKQIKKFCKLTPDVEKLLSTAAIKYGLSGRKYNRILKIARTIADLAGEKEITTSHISQALQFRVDDPEN